MSTNKIDLVRAEIERRIVFQEECIKNSYRLTGKPEEEIILEYKQLLSFIDSLPEEPVSIDFEKELYKAFGQVKDFTLGMRIAKWFYDMGKNSQEPVCEDLEKAADIYGDELDNVLAVCSDNDDDNTIGEYAKEAFKVGAKWQKELFEKNRLEHCDSITEEQYNLEVGFVVQHLDKYNRRPTFLDAIEYGMKVQKEQMMANAIDVTVYIDAGGYPYTPEIELYDYDNDVPLAKEGDKYKVVLIKED